jgi:hypothetical protein
LFGGLGGREKTTTSTTKRVLRPEQESALSQLMTRAQSLSTNPAQGLAPLKADAMTRVNEGYEGLLDRQMSSLRARGIRTPAGSLPGMALRSNLSRLGDLAKVHSDFAGKTLQQQQYGDSLLDAILGQGFEQTTTQKGSGNVAGEALGGGLSSLTTMLMLRKLGIF